MKLFILSAENFSGCLSIANTSSHLLPKLSIKLSSQSISTHFIYVLQSLRVHLLCGLSFLWVRWNISMPKLASRVVFQKEFLTLEHFSLVAFRLFISPERVMLWTECSAMNLCDCRKLMKNPLKHASFQLRFFARRVNSIRGFTAQSQNTCRVREKNTKKKLRSQNFVPDSSEQWWDVVDNDGTHAHAKNYYN